MPERPVFDPDLPAHAVEELARAPELLLPAGADPGDPEHMPRSERLRRAATAAAAAAAALLCVAVSVLTAPDLILVLAASAIAACSVYGIARGAAHMVLSSVVAVPLLILFYLRSGPGALAVIAALTALVLGWQAAQRRLAGDDPHRAAARYHGRYVRPGDLAPADRELVRRAQDAESALAGATAEAAAGAFATWTGPAPAVCLRLVRDRTWRIARSLSDNRASGARPLRVVTGEARRRTAAIEELVRAVTARDAGPAARAYRSLAEPYRY